jgi:hypothetical protein
VIVTSHYRADLGRTPRRDVTITRQITTTDHANVTTGTDHDQGGHMNDQDDTGAWLAGFKALEPAGDDTLTLTRQPAPVGPATVTIPATDVEIVSTLDSQTIGLDISRPDLAHRRAQIERVLVFLAERIRQPDTIIRRRAARILLAGSRSPDAERMYGLRCAPAELVGENVTCRSCKQTFRLEDVSSYYDGTHDGLCFKCTLIDMRPDAAVAAAPQQTIEGEVVVEVPVPTQISAAAEGAGKSAAEEAQRPPRSRRSKGGGQ